MEKDLILRISGETGEIISEFEIGSDESLTTSEKLLKRKKYLENRNQMSMLNNQLGGFVKIFYISNEILYQNTLNPQDVARFLFISTYIDYDNILKKDDKPLNKKELWRLTFIRANIFNELYQRLIDKHFIVEHENGSISVNEEKVIKGEHKENNKSYTRMYINTIRNLYSGCDQRKHKSLGYLFKLIPFLNYETNMVCFENEKFSPMTTQDIMMLLDISVKSKGSISQFNKQLLDFTITFKGKDYPVFGKISFETRKGKIVNGWIVNPCLFYRSSNFANTRTLLSLLFEYSNK